ncbi:MAG: ABC transporter permease DevC [Planctomycetota bacterium]
MITRLLTNLLGRLPIGWLQLNHNRTRLLAAVGGVTFANVLIFMQLGFMNALFESSVFTHRMFDTDIVIMSSDYQSMREANPIPRSRMFQALSVSGVKSVTPIYIGTRQWTDSEGFDTTNFRIIGVNPTRDVFVDADLNKQVRNLRFADTGLVDRRTREFNASVESSLTAGQETPIEIDGRTIRLIGMFEQGASFDVDGSLIVSDQTFLGLFGNRRAGEPTMVLVKTEPSASVDAVVKQMNERLPEGDVRALSKEEFVAAEQNYQATQTPIGFVFGFGVAIGMVVGMVIVYQVLSTDVQDHLPEYATFKAIGYPPRFFLGLVFEEAISLAALGFIPGLVISLSLYHLAATKTGLPISMPWNRPLMVLAMTVVMCTVSGAIATRKLNSADPAELF